MRPREKELWIWDPAAERSRKGHARQRGLVFWENASGGAETLVHRGGKRSLCLGS